MLSLAYAANTKTNLANNSLISYFIDPRKVENFLKNTQTGAAHAVQGADIGVLVHHLMTSMVLCVIQLCIFCYLRRILKRFYQPRTILDNNIGDEDEKSSDNGFCGWIFAIWRRRDRDYLELGLDAYFFLRFIHFLLIFFCITGSMNLAILIPINLTSSNATFSASGLDKFSISNVSKSKASYLNFHFVCSLVTIAVFEILVWKEFQYIAAMRQEYMNSWRHRKKISSRVVLLGNIPPDKRGSAALAELFDQFPSGIEHIWLLDDYHNYTMHHLVANEAIRVLERYLLSIMKNKKAMVRFRNDENNSLDLLLTQKFYPPLIVRIGVKAFSRRVIYIKFPGIMRAFAMQKQVSLVAWSMQTLETSSIVLQQRITELASGDFEKLDKAFLVFKTPESAYLAYQSLLSPKFGQMDESLIEVQKEDVIWPNLMRTSGVIALMIRHLMNALIIILTCLYVVPVSLITLVSQIPFLTQLLPFMGFLRKLPVIVESVFSSIVPTLILSFLTDMQLTIFRFLLVMKGHWTGAEIELDLQVWYFIFMFVQQFLVVSVLSSLVSMFLSFVEKPTSLPILLAANIPMSSIFFFKYLSVKAFALCGSDFLKFRSMTRWVFITNWFDKTPRQRTERTKQLTVIKWGAVYASFSVYAAIGIIYSTIAPLASLFMIVLLIFFSLYYKYALTYMFSKDNKSETNGRLYPRALFQLYAGVYCFEFCLVGIFLSLRNDNGDHTMKTQALIMAFVFGLSVSSNIVGYRRFQKLFRFMPQINEKPEILEHGPDEEPAAICQSQKQLLYFHPCYQYRRPLIILPEDSQGNGQYLILLLSHFTTALGLETPNLV